MVKKAKTANDESLLSSPARSLKRPRTPKQTADASQLGSVRTDSPKTSTSSTPSTKFDSSKLIPTRSSTRKCRSTAKVAVVEDSSDSDCTPPPFIISRSPVKKRISDKRVPRNEKEVTEPDDLTVPQTLSPKSPKKRPKIDRRLPVSLDTFINLCSDEEMNPQPRKKRKVLPADIILISSGDEAEFPRTQFQRTPTSLEHAAVAPDASNEMEMYHNHTPPPVSPPENDESVVDITSGQDMMGIEEILTPRLSRERLRALDRESQENPPVKSLMSEESCSTSFCNTPGPEPTQQIHKVVFKQAKRALLTSLIFGRPMRSLGRSQPRANATLPSPISSKSVSLIESPMGETTPLHQGDTVLDVQNVVPHPPTSSAASSTDIRSMSTGPTDAATPDKVMDTTTFEDTRSPPTGLMEVNEANVEPESSAQVKATDDWSISEDVVPVSDLDEISAKGPTLEIATGENEMMKEYVTSPHREGQAEDHPAESGFTEAELNLNTGSATPNKFLNATTCEEIHFTSTSPLMDIDDTGVEPVFSAQLNATDSRSISEDTVPVPCVRESSAKDVAVVGESAMMKAYDTPTSHEGQADDHLAEAAFITDASPIQNSEKQLPSVVAECVSRINIDIEQAGDVPIHPRVDNTHYQTSSRSAVQADGPTIHPTFRDTHLPSRDSHSHGLLEGSTSPDEPLGDSLTREISPILQTYINSSIFELEHSSNLTLQILFASNKILDDANDLAISLPCYPERLQY